MKSKDEEPRKKKLHKWMMVLKSHKIFILVLKLYIAYLFGPSVFVQFNFDIKVNIFIF
jgi:hypothetical protein